MSTRFPDPDSVRACCAEAGLDAASTRVYLDFAARVAADPALAAQAAAARDHLFEAAGDPTVPGAEAVFGAEAPLLRGLMLLESIRRVRERHSARGVPPDVTHATLERHPSSTLRDYVRTHGHPGADGWIWHWYRTVGSGDLYRLGRLEFIPKQWDYPFRVFDHTGTGEVVALLNAGQNYDDEGHCAGSTAWTTALEESADAIIGNPISPDGYAIRDPLRLPRGAWTQVLGPGVTVLDMHIPGGEPLALDAVRASLAQAGPFFDQFYPDTPFAAFVCDSWLFSTQLEQMLPAESNILRWQREGYLYPGGGDHGDFLNFTFGAYKIDLASAPRDTRLRRAVIAHLERGGTLRCGGYLYLRRDLPRFGSQPYRSH